MPRRPKIGTPTWAEKRDEPSKTEATTPVANEMTPKVDEKRRGMTLRLDGATRKALGHLSVDLDVPMHDLVVEGIRLVLEKHGRK